jgi:hypothetical protein
LSASKGELAMNNKELENAGVPKEFLDELSEPERLSVVLNKYVRRILNQKFDFICTIGMYTEKGNIYFAVYQGHEILTNPEVFEEMQKKDDTVVKYAQAVAAFQPAVIQNPFFIELLKLNKKNKDTIIYYPVVTSKPMKELPRYSALPKDLIEEE